MRNISQNSKLIDKFPLLLATILTVALLSAYARIQNQRAEQESNTLCSIKAKDSKALIDVNDMLLSIKSFTLSDTN